MAIVKQEPSPPGPGTRLVVITDFIRLALVKCTPYLFVCGFLLSPLALPTSVESIQIQSLCKQ